MDVELTINSGVHKGDHYGYNLAESNGKKIFSVNPLFKPAPHIFNREIKMSVLAAEHDSSADGAVQLRSAHKVLNELQIMAEAEEPTRLVAFGQTYIVKINQDGFSFDTLVKEPRKDPEYVVNITCWGMHKYGEYKEE